MGYWADFRGLADFTPKYGRAGMRICSYNPPPTAGVLPMSSPGIAAALACAVLALAATKALAGPCTSDIAQFEATVRGSQGNPLAGLTAPQSVGAQLEHQPTPASVKAAQERLKSRFAATMARAKRYDAQGNRLGCTRELAAAKRMYIP
jgi:hypothetical protein